MKRWLSLTLWLACVVVVGLMGWFAFEKVYAAPKRALLAEIAGARAGAEAYERALEQQRPVRERLERIASTTLGRQFDRLEHQYRTGLSRVAEGSGLSEVVVSSSPAKQERNPAGSAGRLDAGLQRRIRGATNFSVVRAQVKGVGTFEQVLVAMATLGRQPWLHRVEGFSLRPVGRERDRFELRVEVATIWMPDLAKEEITEVAIAAPGSADVEAWQAIVAKNVFRQPTPPPAPPPTVVATAPKVEKPKPPPPPAWGEWKLTGVIAGRRGLEALLVNTRSNERLVLVPGGAVLGAKLIGGEGEQAVFELEGAMWTVRAGMTLADRVRSDSVD